MEVPPIPSFFPLSSRTSAPCAAVLALLVACACGRPPVPDAASSSSPPPSVRTPSGGDDSVVLIPRGGDVWGFAVDVQIVGAGATVGPCRIVVNGARHDATRAVVEGGAAWTATIPLNEGANEAFADCDGGARPPSRSRVVRYVERLPDAMRGAFARARPSSARAGAATARAATPARGEGDGGPVGAVESRPHAGLDGGVVYGVVPPRFGSPPLRAVTRALADLADLGVAAVWLTPVFEAAPGDFGYAVTDYFRVRADYGDAPDLSALVREAHRLGLRVILDLPINDTSALHPYFVDAAAGRASRYDAFYVRDAAGKPTHYFDWTNLPNLNYDDPEVDRFMTYAAEYWMRAFRIDGYRLDAAWGVRERSPPFLGAFAAALRALDPDAFLLAEGSARDPFYVAHGFDAAYDWTEQVGAWAWADVFDPAPGVAARVERALDATSAAGARGGSVFRFLENNDTGARFITRHGPGMTRVAASLLLTLPGTPALFTGQETGVEYEPYVTASSGDGAPRPRNEALRAWYKRLIALRRAHPSLARGGRSPIAVHPGSGDAPGEVLAYERRDPASGEALLVVLNFSESAARVAVDLPAELRGREGFRDLLRDDTLRPRGPRAELNVPGWGALVLAPR